MPLLLGKSHGRRQGMLAEEPRSVLGEDIELGNFTRITNDHNGYNGRRSNKHMARNSEEDDLSVHQEKISNVGPDSSTSATTVSSCLPPVHSDDTSTTHSVQPTGTASFASSSTTLMDKQEADASTDAESSLPPKKHSRLVRNIRFSWLSVYRRLHFLVLLPNLIAVVVLAITGSGILRLPLSTLCTASTANILAAVLIRQELVINLLFIIAGFCPRWLPLRIRRLSAKIYHLGGVHSGASVAATIWFFVYSAAAFSKTDQELGGLRTALWTITALIDVLLILIVLLSMPHFRRRWHNQFEWSHRFFGWTSIGLLWSLIVLVCIAHQRILDAPLSLDQVLGSSPGFWMLILITLSIIGPWLNLRRVPVRAERLSDHAIRLHFDYANAPLCSAPRITDKPLKEWHAFASIPEEEGQGFSVLVSKAGDWTTKIINNPPRFLWKRGLPARGVLNVAPIFKSVVIVATGSGIGPVLSLLKGTKRPFDVRLVWSTKSPQATYKRAIIDDVYAADPNALVIDTGHNKRPNLVELAWKMYVESEAEAIFLISNPDVTKKVVYALESRGAPIFAPIFDS